MKSITAKEFDEMFDRGDDISEFLDFENIKSFKELHITKSKKVVKCEKDRDYKS